jgi:hypothetical protein
MTSTWRTFRTAVGCCVLGLSLSQLFGCVIGNDSDPPVLSVDLYWDTEHDSDRTCKTAKVETMDFRLLDARQNVVEERQGDECRNGFEFTHARLGDYVLEVTGYDADNNPVWSASCDLYLDRFDRLFRCDVDRTAS